MAKIVFFGTPIFARQVLEILANSHEILAVVTQPDRPFGRKQELKASALKDYALQHSLPFFQPDRLDSSLLSLLQSLGAEFFVVVAFGQIFPSFYLQALPCINLHASILPYHRGASPLQEMILEDKKRFGVTAMRMAEGLDSGDILALSILESEEDWDLIALSNRLAQMGGNLLSSLLQNFDLILPLPQYSCDASYCKKIKKEQGRVDFSDSRALFVKFLAFNPWPSVFLDSGLKLTKLGYMSGDGEYHAGEILEIRTSSILLGCQKGIVELIEVQPLGKQKMGVLDYLRGKRIGVGEIFC